MPVKNKRHPIIDRFVFQANSNLHATHALEEEKDIIVGWVRECISIREQHGYPVLLPSISDFVKNKGIQPTGRMTGLKFYYLVPDQKDVAEAYISFMGDEDGVTPVKAKDSARFREIWIEFCELYRAYKTPNEDEE